MRSPGGGSGSVWVFRAELNLPANAATLACMTDKASEADVHGYAVRVEVPVLGGATQPTIFYVRIADQGKAREAARALAGVGSDAEALIVSTLTANAIKQLEEKFGLADGKAMHWMRL